MSSKKEAAGNYEDTKKLVNMLRKQGLFQRAIDAYEAFLKINPTFKPNDDILKICQAGKHWQEMLEKAKKQQPANQENIKWIQQKIEQCKTSANIVQPPRGFAAPKGLPETIVLKKVR